MLERAIEVTEAHLDAAIEAAAMGGSASPYHERCLIAQASLASQRGASDPAARVTPHYLHEPGVSWRLDQRGQQLVTAFDAAMDGNLAAMEHLRSVLPTTVTLQRTRLGDRL